MKTHHHSRDN